MSEKILRSFGESRHREYFLPQARYCLLFYKKGFDREKLSPRFRPLQKNREKKSLQIKVGLHLMVFYYDFSGFAGTERDCLMHIAELLGAE
jgi:hypothetical protein